MSVVRAKVVFSVGVAINEGNLNTLRQEMSKRLSDAIYKETNGDYLVTYVSLMMEKNEEVVNGII